MHKRGNCMRGTTSPEQQETACKREHVHKRGKALTCKKEGKSMTERGKGHNRGEHEKEKKGKCMQKKGTVCMCEREQMPKIKGKSTQERETTQNL